MVVLVPERTDVQRLHALQLANRVRIHRKELKESWKARDYSARSWIEVVAAPIDLEYTWKVQDILRAVPGMAKVRSAHLLRRLDITATKTVEGLTPGQRTRLLEALEAQRRRVRR